MEKPEKHGLERVGGQGMGGRGCGRGRSPMPGPRREAGAPGPPGAMAWQTLPAMLAAPPARAFQKHCFSFPEFALSCPYSHCDSRQSLRCDGSGWQKLVEEIPERQQSITQQQGHTVLAVWNVPKHIKVIRWRLP